MEVSGRSSSVFLQGVIRKNLVYDAWSGPVYSDGLYKGGGGPLFRPNRSSGDSQSEGPELAFVFGEKGAFQMRHHG